jgi:hypothetical protein
MGLMGEIFYLVERKQTGALQLNKGIGSSHISIVCKRGGGGWPVPDFEPESNM